ncbi:hypothetical protein L596_010396 [Steinernema carpocapsae]|uniref:Fukutin n=1 Tax=Steinernema carpocapsae TaxID=34508 RepID=A0A4V6XWN4_STECR|nr:hypothetical protein L596_010396 [Steinernema carpocapsae]
MKLNCRYFIRLSYAVLVTMSFLIMLFLIMPTFQLFVTDEPKPIHPAVLRCLECPIEKGHYAYFAVVEEADFSNLPILIDPAVLSCLDCPLQQNQTVHFANAGQAELPFGFNVVIHTIHADSSKDFFVFEHKDERRAVRRFLTQVTDFKGYKVRIPENPKKFIWEWNRGRLLACLNITMKRPSQEREIPLSFVDEMADLRNLFIAHNVTPLLAGGTLLGWYRECSLIPHTTDVDFAILEEEHSNVLNAYLKKSQKFWFLWELGKLDDCYEFSLFRKARKIDVFYLYSLSTPPHYCSYHFYRNQIIHYEISTYLKDKICAADLLGQLMYVPCNTEEYLEAEYGTGWREDHQSESWSYVDNPKNIVELKQLSESAFNSRINYVNKEAQVMSAKDCDCAVNSIA